MILLYLRTIIVALIFLVLPFIASSVVTFFTLLSVKFIFLGIFGCISLVLFICIAHLNSTLEIFVEATWYEAYRLCKKEDAEDGYQGDHHASHDGHHDHESSHQHHEDTHHH
jgi:hypothetical protein